jgi:hypothetical protein
MKPSSGDGDNDRSPVTVVQDVDGGSGGGMIGIPTSRGASFVAGSDLQNSVLGGNKKGLTDLP